MANSKRGGGIFSSGLLGQTFTAGADNRQQPLSSATSSSEVEQLKQSLSDAHADVDMLRRKVADLQKQLATTKEALDDARGERDRLREHVVPLEKRRVRFRRLVQRSLEQVRFEFRLDKNVAREMHAAAQGRTLEKVAERHGKLEVRQCAVDYSEKLFKWWHDKGLVGSVLNGAHMIPGASMLPGVPSAGSKSLDLQTVTRLKYGQETGVQLRFPDVQPWLCFSLETADRSYDFICPDEYATKCFVLALSRVCMDAKGIMMTRRDFILRKARSKLFDLCAKKGKTLGGVFLEAAELIAPFRPTVNKALLPEHTASRLTVEKDGLPTTTSKPGSLQGLHAFLVSGSSDVAARATPTCRGAWPKTGETWAFTGAVPEVDVYKDSEGKEWANQIKCSDKTTGRRAVTIVSASEGHRFVEIRGTDKLKFVKGWIEVVDSRDMWLLEKVQTA